MDVILVALRLLYLVRAWMQLAFSALLLIEALWQKIKAEKGKAVNVPAVNAEK